MIGIMKLYACLLIAVVSMVKFIDASCMSYGHSCWGAHGKRSNNPPREITPDRWALFKGEREAFFPFKKIMRDNQIQPQFRYPENDGSVPQMSPLMPSYDDDTIEKIFRNSPEELLDENEEFQQQQHHHGKRANKLL